MPKSAQLTALLRSTLKYRVGRSHPGAVVAGARRTEIWPLLVRIDLQRLATRCSLHGTRSDSATAGSRIPHTVATGASAPEALLAEAASTGEIAPGVSDVHEPVQEAENPLLLSRLFGVGKQRVDQLSRRQDAHLPLQQKTP